MLQDSSSKFKFGYVFKHVDSAELEIFINKAKYYRGYVLLTITYIQKRPIKFSAQEVVTVPAKSFDKWTRVK